MATISAVGNPDKNIPVYKSPSEIDDENAKALVLQDAQASMEFLEKNQWSLIWDEIDILIDPPRPLTTWENTNVVQPSVTRSKVATHGNSLHTQIVEGIFYEGPDSFEMTARPGSDQDAMRARKAVISSQLKAMEFENECSEGLLNIIYYGYCPFKWGMRHKKYSEPKFTRKVAEHTYTDIIGQENSVPTVESDEFEFEMVEMWKWEPFFEFRDPRNVLFDPALKRPYINKGRYVIEKYYVTLEDLLDWREQPCYKERLGKYSVEEIESWFNPESPEEPAKLGNLDNLQGATTLTHEGEPDWYKDATADPYAQGLMVLERWDNNKVITVLNSKITIRNEKNIFAEIPYLSSNWWDRTRALIGIGIGRTTGADQRLNQGMTNSGLALLQMLLEPMFVVNDESNIGNQNIRLRKGGFLKVKGPVKDAVAPLELPKMPLGEIMAFLQNSQQESEAADGANEQFIQGTAPGAGGKTSATRTGTGVNAITGAIASRLQGPVGRFVNRVLIPWLYRLDKLNRLYMPLKQVREIVGQELGDSYKLNAEKFLCGECEFDVKAGANLASARALQQLLPLITQIFNNPQILDQLNQIGDEYVDISALLKLWLDSARVPWTQIIKKMTHEQKANRVASNPAVLKAQTDQQKMAQQHANDKDLQQQKTEGAIVKDLISSSFDKGADELLRQSVEAEGKAGALGEEA